MPILTTVGLLQGGVITDAARQQFVDDVNTVLFNGIDDVLFGALAQSIKFEGDGFFGRAFDVKPLKRHIETFPTWHKVFIDVMFQETANALDIDGSTPLSPVLDYTAPLAAFGFPLKQLTIPEFATGMALPDPTFQAQLEFFFDVDAADITPELLFDIAGALPGPSPPNAPKLPTLPSPNDFSFDVPAGLTPPPLGQLLAPPIPPSEFSNITMPVPIIGFLACSVVAAVPTIFATLIGRSLSGELLPAIAQGPIGLVTFASSVVIDAILSCLGINLKNALTFLAGFAVYIERLVAMLIVVVIGSILGEGLLIKLVAKALRLA